MADADGKKLTELRVIDLKTELERRGLDKTGNKAALLDRLSKAIIDEGEDPDEYLIVPSGGSNKISPRKNSGVVAQEEPVENHKEPPVNKEVEIITPKEEPHSETEEESKPIEEEMEQKEQVPVKEEPANEEPVEEEEEEEEEAEKMETEPVSDEASKEVDDKKTPESTPVQDSPTPMISTPAPKHIIEENSAAAVEANGIDTEDSINLTIGEDEENLLAEETETHVKQKDGGAKKRIEENNKKGESKGSSRAEGGTGNKDGISSGESGTKGQKRDDKDKKITQGNTANASSRNLWVSGLSSTTRATDLKQIFSKYGKVIGAKVVTNARTPGTRCYGYVTMSTSEDAAKCIQHLHRTELHGRVISVEKAKGDTQQSHMRKRESNNGKIEKKDEKDTKGKDVHTDPSSVEKKEKDNKKEDDKINDAKKTDEKVHSTDDKKSDSSEKKDDKDADARSTKSTSKKPESERGKRDDKRGVRAYDHHRSHSRSRSRERRRRDDVLTFAKIREERERQRLRERERLVREEERRRREEMDRQREIERRQREEAARLEREREKLRRERERIEQEKAELLRLERERQKLEREKLERERLELKRQQMRLEESRRVPPPPTIKRSSTDRRDIRDLYVEPDRKRLATEHSRRHSPDRVPDRRTEIMERVSERRMDTSPPGRYESSRATQDMAMKKDFKRSSEFTSRSSRPETFTDVSRGREVIVRRESLPTQPSAIDPRQVKESRYDRQSYGRSERDVRRSEPEPHRSSRDAHAGRYSDSNKPPGSSAPGRDSRYAESGRTPSGWHSGPPSTKSFNSLPSSGQRGGDPRDQPTSWSNRTTDNVSRWSNSSSMANALRHPGPPMGYQSSQLQSLGLSAPGTTPSYDRFEPYKSTLANMRKY
ncbi:Similar to Safb: Scaffold attachment factor B1 (Rattus norvegicus) [Cotesia congregata]|uniref:Similar to Safb: Scaffold attachment factor B1 (Rattus norvegicus) n=1 Tax=Cotesia congregata TaxID=51543 RepID=A0A8J2HTC6_COTCN|nr:Similar to Safb: Scaffold attachment factor B1 (Rattus norvegicus) [Cotesia congregata]